MLDAGDRLRFGAEPPPPFRVAPTAGDVLFDANGIAGPQALRQVGMEQLDEQSPTRGPLTCEEHVRIGTMAIAPGFLEVDEDGLRLQPVVRWLVVGMPRRMHGRLRRIRNDGVERRAPSRRMQVVSAACRPK